jgi:hypothetical protein
MLELQSWNLYVVIRSIPENWLYSYQRAAQALTLKPLSFCYMQLQLCEGEIGKLPARSCMAMHMQLACKRN